MAVSYKNLMRNKRKLIENHPEEVEIVDQSIRLYWCGEKWLDKSQMAKLNRSKNPCGPRMSFIGRRGWQPMLRKFRMLHGRDPTPQEGLRLQFIREKKNTVKEADGTIREVISTKHANPYTEQKTMEVDQRIINLTQPDPSQLDTPITLSVIEKQKVIAEVFGVSKRGKVLGLGTAAANVVPRVFHERATHCNEGSASSIEETTHLKGVVQDLTAKLNQMQVMMDILMAQQLQASTSTNNSISQPPPH